MIRLPYPLPVAYAALVTAMRVAVPAVEGITVRQDAVEVRRLAGEFSDTERDALVAVLAAHDGTTLNAQQSSKRQEAKAEYVANLFTDISLAEIDTRIDAISNLAELKVFLKKLVRYLKAKELVGG